MNLHETALQLLEKIPEHRLEEVISFLQNLLADEEADDLFCEKLVEEYEKSPDKGVLLPPKISTGTTSTKCLMIDC